MKVLFLYCSTNMSREQQYWYYDEGVASLISSLRHAGHDAAFRMIGEGDDLASVLPWIGMEEREDGTLIIFMTSLLMSAYGHDYPDTFARVASLRQAVSHPIGFIGLYATLHAEKAIDNAGVDFIGRGEMDEALVEFCNTFEAGGDLSRVANFWIKQGSRVYRNELRPLVRDLDRLPFPARDLLPVEMQANERSGTLTLVATRGCPLDCNFCTNNVFQKLYQGKGRYARTKGVSYLLREILAARESVPGIRHVFFHDDIFAMKREWAHEFFERYPREVGLPSVAT